MAWNGANAFGAMGSDPDAARAIALNNSMFARAMRLDAARRAEEQELQDRADAMFAPPLPQPTPQAVPNVPLITQLTSPQVTPPILPTAPPTPLTMIPEGTDNGGVEGEVLRREAAQHRKQLDAQLGRISSEGEAANERNKALLATRPFGMFNEDMDRMSPAAAARANTTIGGNWPGMGQQIDPGLEAAIQQRAARTRQMLRNPTGRHEMIGGPPLLAALTGGEPAWQGFVDNDPQATADAVRATVAQGGGRVTARRDKNGNPVGLEGIWDGQEDRHEALKDAQQARHERFLEWQATPNKERPGYNAAIHQRAQNKALAREARMNGGYGPVMANRMLGGLDDALAQNGGGAGGGGGFNPLLAGLAFGAPGFQAAMNGIGDANELAARMQMFYKQMQQAFQEHKDRMGVEGRKLDIAANAADPVLQGKMTADEVAARRGDRGATMRQAARTPGMTWDKFRVSMQNTFPDASEDEIRTAWRTTGNIPDDEQPPGLWRRALNAIAPDPVGVDVPVNPRIRMPNPGTPLT